MLTSILLLAGCGGDSAQTTPAPVKPVNQATQPEATKKAYTPVQEPLEGGPYPALLHGIAWFTKENGKPIPGPARLDIYRQAPDGWKRVRLEDPDSNVFHKAIPHDGGILTIGAEKAMVKHWTFADGKWAHKVLWEKDWGGKFQRMRDVEIGDVDGDGKDELVIATHDSGVVAVISPDEGPSGIIELDQKADTFVHEIELGDIDGDGSLEFFATPSDRNKANASQAGMIVMYQRKGDGFERFIVDNAEDTHAKEVLAHDIDGDGKSEFYGVLEAETGPGGTIKTPVRIRQYTIKKDGTFAHTDIATIDDRQCRFLVPGDFDGDGKTEMVAASMTSGLWFLDSDDGKTWTTTNIAKDSGGFEHASYATDLDGDKKMELYVASDKQSEFRSYSYDPAKKSWNKEFIARLDKDVITWNIVAGTL